MSRSDEEAALAQFAAAVHRTKAGDFDRARAHLRAAMAALRRLRAACAENRRSLLKKA